MSENDSVEPSNPKAFDQNDLPEIVADFKEIYDTRNPVEREYKLVKNSKKFDGLPDDYRRIFAIYAEIQKQSHWTSYFKKTAQVIQAFGFIAIVLTTIKFGWDAADRHRKHLFENWDIVALNTNSKGNAIRVSRGRKEALEYLSDQDVDLSRLQAQDAVLNQVNLPKLENGPPIQLQEADFQSATLYNSYLAEANLYNSKFQKAVLGQANFKGAMLNYARFQGADLQNACFDSANLEYAVFDKGTNLDKTDFRGATGLDLTKIKTAKNYQKALYNDADAVKLGLSLERMRNILVFSTGCSVKPRSRNWWANLSG